ncbi:hypothetical protein DFH08DRAFT_837344 [Mycena albidolilacea]|uniref:Uncharacterized protein n=1 Tax=Mycena albidolilacea TaxID=1033008 RepID=A0AAD7AT17_9AGAR|nr:hypothetical protein DFH08DRAFT_837344 [Mycena albidolilacea]
MRGLCYVAHGSARRHTACRACHAFTPSLFFSLSLFFFLLCHHGRRVRDGLDDLFAFSSGFNDKIHVYFSSNVLSGMYVVCGFVSLFLFVYRHDWASHSTVRIPPF